MTDAFICVLLVMAVQKYLGLGNWIWFVCAVLLVIDLVAYVAARKGDE